MDVGNICPKQGKNRKVGISVDGFERYSTTQ